MIRLLDRYIARQYLMNVGLLLTCLCAMVILIDFSLNFDEYLDIAGRVAGSGQEAKASSLQTAALTVWLVWDLWWPRLFQLYNYLLGLVLVGGMGFTCAQLVKHREFVAVLAGGVSLHRLARPMLIVALALTTLLVANREFLLPRLAPLLVRDKKQAGKQQLGSTNQPLCADSRGRILYAREVDLDNGDIRGLWVWERDSEGLMTTRIRADSARWENGGWTLAGGLVEQMKAAEDRTAVSSPQPLARFETDLDPTAMRLRRFEGYSSNLSTAQITRLINRYRAEKNAPQDRVEQLERLRWGRISMAAVNLLGLLLCLPFFLRREPCSMVAQSLKAAPVGIGAIMGGLLGASAAIPGLPPQVGVFVPVMVLIPLAIAAVTSIKT